MKIITLCLTVCALCAMHPSYAQQKKYVLALHGGAGTILKENMSDEQEMAYRRVLKEALETGYNILQGGSSSLDAVEATIHILEDSPLFNAAKGAVFTHDGRNELDASIMEGASRKAGAVGGVTNIKNPISAARAVMERSEHVMMVGRGAEAFAEKVGLEIVDPSYFFTQPRWDGLQRILQRDSVALELDHDSKAYFYRFENRDEKFGTVGCVALDQNGTLAAGTSTGGMTNKKYGRVGDSPIIGAGTYADNATVAVSGTGWGEFFIRSVAAFRVSALMAYKGASVGEAAQEVIDEIAQMGGDGGLIALDHDGNVAMPFNTEGMYRGMVAEDGTVEIYIYK